MFKILGNETPVVTQLGVMTEGIGFPLRPVDDTSMAVVVSAPRLIFDAESLVTQTPTGIGVDTQISFGGAQTTPEASLAANGLVTANITATFNFVVTFSLARNTNPQDTITGFKFEINGVQSGTPLGVQLTDSDTVIPFQFEANIAATAGDTFGLWFYRDATGNNDGELRALPLSLYGTAPSAGLRLSIYEATPP